MKKKCPSCSFPIVKKNGRRNGCQRYKCMACGHQFTGGRHVSAGEIWELYQQNKLSIARISSATGLSVSTVKRRIKGIEINWTQPVVKGTGTIHIDATYSGRKNGVIVAIEPNSGRLLYMKHIAHERISDYLDAVSYVESCGYEIRGIVIDGIQALFSVLDRYLLQMCQFHIVAIIRRKLTKNPQLPAGVELLNPVYRMKEMDKESFTQEYSSWKLRWQSFLAERTFNAETGKYFYTHQRLRPAMISLSFI